MGVRVKENDMITDIRNGITILRADKGKWLSNGSSWSNTDIYIGVKDSVSNWIEVDTEPVLLEEEDPESIISELEGLL